MHEVSQPNWVILTGFLYPSTTPVQYDLTNNLRPTLLISNNCKISPGNCISAAFLLLVYWSRCPWGQFCQITLEGFPRHIRVTRILALSGFSMGVLYLLWTVLCFQEAKPLFPGLACPLVCFTWVRANSKSPVKFHYLIPFHCVTWTNT